MKTKTLITLCLVLPIFSLAQSIVEEVKCIEHTNKELNTKIIYDIDIQNKKLAIVSKNKTNQWLLELVNINDFKDIEHCKLDSSISKIYAVAFLDSNFISLMYKDIHSKTKLLILLYNKNIEIAQTVDFNTNNDDYDLYETGDKLIIVGSGWSSSETTGDGSFLPTSYKQIYHFSLKNNTIDYTSERYSSRPFENLEMYFVEEEGYFYMQSSLSIVKLNVYGNEVWEVDNLHFDRRQEFFYENGNLTLANYQGEDVRLCSFDQSGNKISEAVIEQNDYFQTEKVFKLPNDNGYVLLNKNKNNDSDVQQVFVNSQFEKLSTEAYLGNIAEESHRYLISEEEQTYIQIDDDYKNYCINIQRLKIPKIEFAIKPPKIWPILVGVAKYQTPNFDLETTDNHTYELVEHLEATHYGNKRVAPFIDRAAKKEDILNELERVFTGPNVSKEDMILFFFSGHGVILDNDEKENIAVLCMYDFEADNDDTYISHDEIMDIVNKSVAKHKIIILEACQDYSSLSPNNDIIKIINNKAMFAKKRAEIKKGTVVITSCTTGEKSKEYTDTGAVFSHFLLKGIDERKADGYDNGKKDNIITTKELFNYIKDNVDKYCKNKNVKCQTTTIEPKDYENIPLFYLR